MEFKHCGDALVEDIVKKKKEWHKIHWLLCWTLGSNTRDFMDNQIGFTEAADPSTRDYAGVTHLAASDRGGAYRIHVISLRDLLEQAK